MTASTGLPRRRRSLLRQRSDGGADEQSHFDEPHSCERYAPHFDLWFEVTPLPYVRFSPAAAVVRDAIVVGGGLDDAGREVSTACEFDGVEWRAVGSMLVPRCGHSFVAYKGFGYAVGGRVNGKSSHSVERYDPATRTWAEIKPLFYARANCGVAVVDGYLYAIGGVGEWGRVSTVERYDSRMNHWSVVQYHIARCPDAVAVKGSRVFIFGNMDHSIEEYERRRSDEPRNSKLLKSCPSGLLRGATASTFGP